MMKGISVWLFSKMVMLIFLLMVFATVLGFLKIVSEKVGSDSAESLAIQVKDSIRSVTAGDLISATRIIPLPTTLPEKSEIAQTPETRIKPYTLRIMSTPATNPAGGSNDKIVTVAVSWELTAPKSYAAAASFVTAKPIPAILLGSRDYKFISIILKDNVVNICGCNEIADCKDLAAKNNYCAP